MAAQLEAHRSKGRPVACARADKVALIKGARTLQAVEPGNLLAMGDTPKEEGKMAKMGRCMGTRTKPPSAGGAESVSTPPLRRRALFGLDALLPKSLRPHRSWDSTFMPLAKNSKVPLARSWKEWLPNCMQMKQLLGSANRSENQQKGSSK